MSVFGGYGAESYDEQELVQELMTERAKRIDLEEECDTLALANVELQREVHELQKKLADATRGAFAAKGCAPSNTSSKTSGANEDDSKLEDVEDFLHEDAPVVLSSDGGGSACKQKRLVLKDACSGTNPLSVIFVYLSPGDPGSGSTSSSSSDSTEEITFIACGGVDKMVSLYDLRGNRRAQWLLSGPVLALSHSDGLLAAACMDGAVYIIDMSALPDKDAKPAGADLAAQSQVQLLEKHTKWAVGVKFSPDGTFLATLGHDRQAHLYTHVSRDQHESAAASAEYKEECGVCCTSSSIHYDSLGVVLLPNTPESFVFVPAPNEAPCNAGFRLLVAVRDSLYLKSISLSRTKLLQPGNLPFVPAVTDFIMLNERIFDTHQGFAPLQLSLSPNEKHLFVSTDKDFHFVLDASYFPEFSDEAVCGSSSDLKEKRSKRIAVLVGHNGGAFSKPAACWSPCSQYIYTNSDTDSAVKAHHFPHAVLKAPAGSAPARNLTGEHKGIVRAVASHATKHWLLTASYDHSVVLWE